MSLPPGPSPRPLEAVMAARLYARADAARWGVTPERFALALTRALEKPGDPENLHLEDLALAVACADGHDAAWECFLRTYRAELQRAAIAIAGGSHGEELVETLVADLFGLDPKGTGRRSLFEYFHGRSRLATWLRALLARRHIDALRAGRRVTSLDADERAAERFEDRGAVAPDPDRERLVAALQQALDSALAGLESQDRLRLACYHVDEMTLAQIGRLFREHESTVSRKLQRIRQVLRERVDAHLRETLRLGPEEIRDCYRQALEEGTVTARGLRLVVPPEAAQDGAQDRQDNRHDSQDSQERQDRASASVDDGPHGGVRDGTHDAPLAPEPAPDAARVAGTPRGAQDSVPGEVEADARPRRRQESAADSF